MALNNFFHCCFKPKVLILCLSFLFCSVDLSESWQIAGALKIYSGKQCSEIKSKAHQYKQRVNLNTEDPKEDKILWLLMGAFIISEATLPAKFHVSQIHTHTQWVFIWGKKPCKVRKFYSLALKLFTLSYNYNKVYSLWMSDLKQARQCAEHFPYDLIIISTMKSYVTLPCFTNKETVA